MPMYEIISARCPDHLFTELDEYCRKRKLYRSTIIIDAVAAYLAQAGSDKN